MAQQVLPIEWVVNMAAQCLFRRDGLFLDRREDIPDVEAMVLEAEAAGARAASPLLCGLALSRTGCARM